MVISPLTSYFLTFDHLQNQIWAVLNTKMRSHLTNIVKEEIKNKNHN